jgi:TolB-like protein
MIQDIFPDESFVFTSEEIRQHVNHIYLYPPFNRSAILRRFLSYIVEESIHGHANCLKEYTIAVQVLDKAVDFKPQNNCIVRIHASRLRRALKRYYLENGALDAVRITIPPGSYVPTFKENNSISDIGEVEGEISKNTSIAIVPFWHFLNNEFENSLSDGLGLQLSTELMKLRGLSVIAYHFMKNLLENTTDFKSLAQTLHTRYLLTGNIQTMGKRVRVFIQLIDNINNNQALSKMYDLDYSDENIFNLQDEFLHHILPDLHKAFDSLGFATEKHVIKAIS